MKISTIENKTKDLSDLNNLLFNSNLVLLAGKSGIGKTSFSINYSKYISNKFNKKVLYFTLEMNKNEVEEYKNNYKELEFTGNSKLNIFDNISSIQDLKNILSKEKDFDLVVIDYIQLINSINDSDLKKNIDYSIKNLKEISKDLNLPIIIISYLPSNLNNENNNIPNPKDLHLINYKDFDLILMMYENNSKNIIIYDQERIIGEISLI